MSYGQVVKPVGGGTRQQKGGASASTKTLPPYSKTYFPQPLGEDGGGKFPCRRAAVPAGKSWIGFEHRDRDPARDRSCNVGHFIGDHVDGANVAYYSAEAGENDIAIFLG